MKKSLILAFSLVSSFSYATPSGITIPAGYNYSEGNNGAALYKKTGYHAIYVDFSRAQLKMGHLNYTGEKTKWGHKLYTKYGQVTFWNTYHVTGKTFGFVNGQFFNVDRTWDSPISYPLKSNGYIHQQLADKDEINNRDRKLYSLYKSDGSYYLLGKYNTGIINYSHVTDLFAGFHRDERTSSTDGTAKDQRIYIGAFPESYNCNAEVTSCKLKGVLFLLGEGKTINNMISELNRWGVNDGNIVRMDGGGSAQYKTANHDYAERAWSPRWLPHMIEIRGK